MSDSEVTPCWIYRSTKKDEMYLYVGKEDGLDEVPDALRQRFGRGEFVMQLDLHNGRPLARADVDTVISAIKEQGFYLQMPPKLEPHLYHGNED